MVFLIAAEVEWKPLGILDVGVSVFRSVQLFLQLADTRSISRKQHAHIWHPLASIGIHWPSCCGGRAEELISEGGSISHLLLSVCEVRFSCLPQRLHTSRISCIFMLMNVRNIQINDIDACLMFVCVCVWTLRANIRDSNPWIPWQSDNSMHMIWRGKCTSGTATKASFYLFSVCDGYAGSNWYLVPSMQAVNGSVRHLVWMISTEVSRLQFVLASSGNTSPFAVFK